MTNDKSIDGKVNDQFLVRIDKATRLLASCQTVKEAKDCSDMAAALKVVARRKKASSKHRNFATALDLRCERRLGELLKAMPENRGAEGNPGGRGAKIVRSNGATTQRLADVGVSKDESSRAKKLAGVDGDHFQAVVAQLEATEDMEIPKGTVVEALEKRDKSELTKLAEANAKKPLPFRDESVLTDVIEATELVRSLNIEGFAAYLKETATGRKHVREGHLEMVSAFWPAFIKQLKAKIT